MHAASLRRRFRAGLLDLRLAAVLFLGSAIPLAVLGGLSAGITGMPEAHGTFITFMWCLVILLYLVVPWLYCTVPQSGYRQATIGMRWAELVISTATGAPLTFLRASVRYWKTSFSGWVPCGLPCAIGSCSLLVSHVRCSGPTMEGHSGSGRASWYCISC